MSYVIYLLQLKQKSVACATCNWKISYKQKLQKTNFLLMSFTKCKEQTILLTLPSYPPKFATKLFLECNRNLHISSSWKIRNPPLSTDSSTGRSFSRWSFTLKCGWLKFNMSLKIEALRHCHSRPIVFFTSNFFFPNFFLRHCHSRPIGLVVDKKFYSCLGLQTIVMTFFILHFKIRENSLKFANLKCKMKNVIIMLQTEKRVISTHTLSQTPLH
jgi:hypothetical protein